MTLIKRQLPQGVEARAVTALAVRQVHTRMELEPFIGDKITRVPGDSARQKERPENAGAPRRSDAQLQGWGGGGRGGMKLQP